MRSRVLKRSIAAVVGVLTILGVVLVGMAHLHQARAQQTATAGNSVGASSGLTQAGMVDRGNAGSDIVVGPVIRLPQGQPPTPDYCLSAYGVACYGPEDIRHAYNVDGLYAEGYEGSGQTIAIFDSYGSATIQNDLRHFDQQYGLPDPPSFQVYYPYGQPTLNYANQTSPANLSNDAVVNQVTWAYETTLDVEWAHVIAPKAKLLLVVTATAGTQGVQGLRNLINAEQLTMQYYPQAHIFSQSFSTTEQNFLNGGSYQTLLPQFHAVFEQGVKQRVTVFAATGDLGAANPTKQGGMYTYPTIGYPASDPDVTAVGGTQFAAPTAGTSAYPTFASNPGEQVWNDFEGSTGGGYSVLFSLPNYQSGTVSGSWRATPDVSMNAAALSAVNIYQSFDPQYGPGWVPTFGTSVATPEWAAIAALADQYAGSHNLKPLGLINPALYTLGTGSTYVQDFHDVISGNNSFDGVTGYNAGPGWDATTGWGTPNVANLVPDLVRAVDA